MEYYIFLGETPQGPLDYMGVIKHIRTGMVEPHTPVSTNREETPLPAGEMEEFEAFFDDEETPVPPLNAPRTGHSLTFGQTLKDGWDFLLDNQFSAIAAGLTMLLSVVILAAGFGIPVAGILLATPLIFIIYTAFLLYIRRRSNGQETNSRYIYKRIKEQFSSLAVAGFIIGIPLMIGLPLILENQIPVLRIAGFAITVAGSFLTLSLFALAPYLITLQGMQGMQGLRQSASLITARQKPYFGIVTTLVMLNIIGLVTVLGLLILLPITSAALAEIYEDGAAHHG